jgi:hypothetical protein
MADVAGGNQEQLEQGAIACTFVIMFMHLIEGFGLRVRILAHTSLKTLHASPVRGQPCFCQAIQARDLTGR